jgi:phosphoenolpyruvate-protein phosphotransferase
MPIFRGIPASPGFAAGPACPVLSQTIDVQRYRVENTALELARFESALAAARKQLTGIAEQAHGALPAAEAAIFEAHILILDDPELGDQVRQQVQDAGWNVEAAWDGAINAYAQILAGMDNEYLAARAADVRDVGRRVLRLLLNLPEDTFTIGSRPAIIVARDLTPSDTIRLDRRRVLAFCTAEGGPTSHTAILAKSLGIPAVVGAGAQLLAIPAGTHLLVDGERGEVLAEPDAAAAADFQARSGRFAIRAAEALHRASEPAQTRDGKRVEVVANIGGVEDARTALAYGAEGVGLFRTEFLYLERQSAPDEQEQTTAYAAVMQVMETRPVVVRTMDIGGDKELPYLDLGREANPFLGCRAIRISLAEPEMFKVQLRALLRAAGGVCDMRIMFPMIATLAEVRQAKALLAEARRELQAAGAPLPDRLQAGIMVEIPSVVVLADQFAQEVDFFSIGTNDLTQYTFAAERTNEKVAYLADACHPAILRQIQTVIDAAHRRGIWAGVCGELAGDPDAAPLLLGLGLDEFSMAPTQIPLIKSVLRCWSVTEARALALQALQTESAEEVRALVRASPPASIQTHVG